jgi:hypothetical protein
MMTSSSTPILPQAIMVAFLAKQNSYHADPEGYQAQVARRCQSPLQTAPIVEAEQGAPKKICVCKQTITQQILWW